MTNSHTQKYSYFHWSILRKKVLLWSALSALLLLHACSSETPSKPGASETSKHLGLIFTSDYVNGELRLLDIEKRKLLETSLSFHSDSKIIVQEDQVFILERFGADNIVELDAKKMKNLKISVLYQSALEEGANPSSIVSISPTEAWLGLEGLPKLLKINPKEKAKVIKEVDLSAFIVGDNLSPNLVDLALQGDTLWALLQRLDSYVPVLNGLVVLLDAVDGRVLDTIALQGKNPTQMYIENGSLWVSSLGAFNQKYGSDADSTRGVEKIEVKTKKSSFVWTGKELGGGVSSFTMDTKAQKIYASITEEDGNTKVMELSLKEEKLKHHNTVRDASGFVFWYEHSQSLYIGDRSYDRPGLLIYNKSAGYVRAEAKDMLPPSSMAVIEF